MPINQNMTEPTIEEIREWLEKEVAYDTEWVAANEGIGLCNIDEVRKSLEMKKALLAMLAEREKGGVSGGERREMFQYFYTIEKAYLWNKKIPPINNTAELSIKIKNLILGQGGAVTERIPIIWIKQWSSRDWKSLVRGTEVGAIDLVLKTLCEMLKALGHEIYEGDKSEEMLREAGVAGEEKK